MADSEDQHHIPEPPHKIDYESNEEDSDFDDIMLLRASLNQMDGLDVEIIRDTKKDDIGDGPPESKPETDENGKTSHDTDTNENMTPNKKRTPGRYWSEDKCFICNNTGHKAAECTKPCFLCGIVGHATSRCRTPICFLCGVAGHVLRDCDSNGRNRRRSEGDSYASRGRRYSEHDDADKERRDRYTPSDRYNHDDRYKPDDRYTPEDRNDDDRSDDRYDDKYDNSYNTPSKRKKVDRNSDYGYNEKKRSSSARKSSRY